MQFLVGASAPRADLNVEESLDGPRRKGVNSRQRIALCMLLSSNR